MSTTYEHPASDRQKSYIAHLLNDREMTPEARSAAAVRIAGLSRTLASAWIEKLLTLPKAAESSLATAGLPGADAVPAGRYAVENAEGELRFYRVARSRRPGSSRVWINVQHGPSESEVPFSVAGYEAILGAIVDAGPAEAMRRYGFEIGHCGSCGTRLTNRISRELGIGPVCGGRMFGEGFKGRVKEARAAIVERGENPDEDVDGDDFNDRWLAHKAEFAAREREQERAAYEYEMREG